MPVSYKALYEEDEPFVINSHMLRQSIEAQTEKQQTMLMGDVKALALSYRNLVKIEHLHGLASLEKLRLDCNHITRIENLDHLTNLTWLDLSFNHISKIEGLDGLNKLVDLSLCANHITELKGLDYLKRLQCLSLGSNQLSKLENLSYLHQFENLELLTLRDNPLCREGNYKTYILSHLKHLKFLDYNRVNEDDITTAYEHHQDEVLDLHEKDEMHEEEQKVIREAEAQAAMMRDANLQRIDGLFDSLIKSDPDWAKLAQVPGLLDGWNETRDKFTMERDSFKAAIYDLQVRKKTELSQWLEILQNTCGESDKASQLHLAKYEKNKKHLLRRAREDPCGAAKGLTEAKNEVTRLKDIMMTSEMHMVEVLEDLIATLERSYSDFQEQSKQAIMQFFANVRDLEGSFNNHLTQQALKLFDEKNHIEGSDELDALKEEVQDLMADKDVIFPAIQASHDLHTSMLDAVEDEQINEDARRALDLISNHRNWAYTRNRERVVEITTYHEGNMQELNALLRIDDDDNNI